MGDKFAAALAGDDDDKPMITAADVYGKGGALMPRRDVIKREADGTLTYKRATMTPVGLVMPEDMSADELADLGKVLLGMESSIQWLLGDWLNRAERVWGRIYDDVPDYSYQTLRDYAYVARNVELSIRNQQLSFMHHRLVAAMDAEQQAGWLAYAAENSLTVAQLRNAMRPEQPQRDMAGGQVKRWGAEVVAAAGRMDNLSAEQRDKLRSRAEWLAAYYAEIAERAK